MAAISSTNGFQFNQMRGALEPQEKIAPAFNFRTVQNSLQRNIGARNKPNEHYALEEQSERNAEEAAFIASLNLSEEELEKYLEDPDEFIRKARKSKRNNALKNRSARNARRALAIAELPVSEARLENYTNNPLLFEKKLKTAITLKKQRNNHNARRTENLARRMNSMQITSRNRNRNGGTRRTRKSRRTHKSRK